MPAESIPQVGGRSASRTAIDGWGVAPEGVPFIVLGVSLAGLGWVAQWMPLAVVGLGWAGVCCFFFRNPARAIPTGEGLVVAPADGTIIGSGEAVEPHFLRQPMRKVSIFLSVFNVHVNRVPIGGNVVETRYVPGRFRVASHREASATNEQNAIWLRGTGGAEVVMVQVAGRVARRIVCDVAAGDAVERGERCGIIRFGSRVDLYLPSACRLDVAVGDRVRGGATILGRLPEAT